MLPSRRITVVTALAWLGSSGCAYVSQNEYEAKVESLDQDQDGVLDIEDCAQLDPARFPGNDEVAFDGIDQDCDAKDLVDADGDGFAAQAFASWPGEAEEFWPAEVPRDAVDCDDDSAGVFPGASDVPYDGIDANCDGSDDYDADGDGYIRAQDSGNSTLPTGDCLDTNADVRPGSTVADVWYDGVDQNCAGNNDFDKDGDGFMPDAPAGTSTADWQNAFRAFCNLHGYTTGACASGAAKYGDCEDDVLTSPVNPALVFPGAPDAFYDGADSDCGRDHDFDQDGDGYVPDTYTDELATYLTTWGLTSEEIGALGSGDCGDTDATIHPAAVEALYDAVDQDCNGETNGTAWRSNGYAWKNTRDLASGVNDRHFLLVAGAEHTSAASTLSNPGLALYMEPPACNDSASCAASGTPRVFAWFNNTTTSHPFGGALDMIASDDRFVVLATYVHATSGKAYGLLKHMVWDTVNQVYGGTSQIQKASPASETGYVDVDLRQDADGDYWGLACGNTSLIYLSGSRSEDTLTDRMASGLTSGYYGFGGTDVYSTCFLTPPTGTNGDTALGHLCGAGGCDTHSLRADTNAANNPDATSTAATYPTKSFAQVNHSGGYTAAVGSDGTLTLYTATQSFAVLGDFFVTHAEAVEDAAGNVYVVAAVADETADGADDVVIAHGDPFVSADWVIETWELTVGANTYDAQSVTVSVSDDQLFVAASGASTLGSCTGDCDAVAWMFLGI